ncbi:hypothetical protein [Salipiger aestuarii]|uniref:hypothetical protein n=1 Tax=Salipiger aestuarii TaxID=568098 RepID=UPI00123B0680|nr:hypothetical protein [Salipiger aestuarii]
MIETVFQTSEYIVKFEGTGSRDCFVTFQSATKTPGLHRPGFGQVFFRKRNIDAFHVIPAESDWYQHRQLSGICTAIRRNLENYRRVITYGSSMGGYAAINFAHLVGATDVIALSPQFTIDPARAPDETRYFAAFERMPEGFVHDQPAGRDWSGIRVNLIYDPFDRLDAYQAGLAQEIAGARHLRLRHATHPVTAVLGTDALKRFLTGYADDGATTATTLVQDFRRDRRDSWVYWAALAQRYKASVARRLRCIETSIALDDARPSTRIVKGNLCLQARRWQDAIRAFNEASVLDRRLSAPFVGKAKAFLALRQADRAAAAVAEAGKRGAGPETMAALNGMLSRVGKVGA